MNNLSDMHPASVVVIAIILALFAVAVVMLFAVCAVYRRQSKLAAAGDIYRSHMLHDALDDYTAAYRTFGEETNTPAIIGSAIRSHLGFPLFCERFLNSAVSLFVTLGLLGTFLGLSMSVSSLTKLLGSSSGAEWQIVLGSVGDGLMSALSGMGVAFYTSLVGVACSIVLTLLRSVCNPESVRAGLENEMELWLDHRTAPRLTTDHVSDDSELIKRMTVGLNSAAGTMDRALKESAAAMQKTMEEFNRSVGAFNGGVRDFSEFDYNLRGTVERLDVAIRDFSAAVRRVTRGSEGSDRA